MNQLFMLSYSIVQQKGCTCPFELDLGCQNIYGGEMNRIFYNKIHKYIVSLTNANLANVIEKYCSDSPNYKFFSNFDDEETESEDDNRETESENESDSSDW